MCFAFRSSSFQYFPCWSRVMFSCVFANNVILQHVSHPWHVVEDEDCNNYFSRAHASSADIRIWWGQVSVITSRLADIWRRRLDLPLQQSLRYENYLCFYEKDFPYFTFSSLRIVQITWVWRTTIRKFSHNFECFIS